ncbi:hypothetical protein EMCRGX_G013593 [Ephydatia muelleri]
MTAFPHEIFPSLSPKTRGVGGRYYLGGQGDVQYEVLEYGKMAGMKEVPAGGVCFKSEVQSKHVRYKTHCIPLASPNTRTPYDFFEKRSEYTKYDFIMEMKFFRHNFPTFYCPFEILEAEVMSEHQLRSQLEVYDPLQGPVVCPLPCSQSSCARCVLYASGANLQTLTVGLLVEVAPQWSGDQPDQPAVSQRSGGHQGSDDGPGDWSFVCASRLGGPLHMEPVEAFEFPDRIHGIEAVCVQGSVLVCVRGDYHIAFFEGPMEGVVNHTTSEYQATPPHQDPSFSSSLLTLLSLYQSSVCISSSALCPYILGEGVVVLETGSVYHWTKEEGFTLLQSALAPPTQPTHFWQCCYGPHPRSIVICEHVGVSIGTFHGGTLSLKVLLSQPHPHLPPSSIISSLAHHPTNPFHLLISTTSLLILLDVRQEGVMLLIWHHDLLSPPTDMSVHCSGMDTTILLTCANLRETILFSYTGGSGDQPPHANCLPHIVDNPREFSSAHNLDYSSMLLGDRLEQPTLSCSLVALSDGSMAALMMSSIGDLFYQCWRYDIVPVDGHDRLPLLSHHLLWAKMALAQEKQLEFYDDRPTGSYHPIGYATDVSTLTALGEYLTCSDTSVPSSTGTSDPPQTRCAFCGALCEGGKDKLFRAIEQKSRINPLDAEGTEPGIEALAKVCVFPVVAEEEGVERRLWEGWGSTQPPSGDVQGGREAMTSEDTSGGGTGEAILSAQTSLLTPRMKTSKSRSGKRVGF